MRCGGTGTKPEQEPNKEVVAGCAPQNPCAPLAFGGRVWLQKSRGNETPQACPPNQDSEIQMGAFVTKCQMTPKTSQAGASEADVAQRQGSRPDWIYIPAAASSLHKIPKKWTRGLSASREVHGNLQKEGVIER